MKHLFITAITALILGACTTPKNIAYFQDATPDNPITIQQDLSIKVRPEDKLSIIVSAQDGALSALFNLVQNQNRLASTVTGTKTIGENVAAPTQTGYYTVDSRGDIDFPVLGKLHIAGMSREEVGQYIVSQLTGHDLVKDPIVTVEFANTGISVLGEVAAPGRYEFNKDHMTLVEALAAAGDLTNNGMRDNITVIRSDGNTQSVYKIDITDAAALAASPAYYLQQNDVIYVEPNDKKKRESTPNGNTPYTPSFWVSMGSFAVTIATLIVTLSR